MQTTKLRWGILGCGGIARAFVRALAALPKAEVTAAGSATPDRARQFAEECGIRNWHGSHEALAADPEVDIVYVATTHNFHYDHVRLCLEHGKAVLCEKPFTVNAAQARELFVLARSKGLFLMEAMWTRCLPAILDLKQRLADGAIGEVERLDAHFWKAIPFDPAHRFFNRDLAGGALLDLGIYPLTLADIVFGGHAPVAVTSRAELGTTGVDETSYYFLRYPSGAQALLSSSGRATSPREALISGRRGWIKVHQFMGASRYVMKVDEEPLRTFDFPFIANGYEYEAAEVMRCLRAGLLESPLVSLETTSRLLDLMDGMRGEWGLRYPGESATIDSGEAGGNHG
jgi:predicted dehydrogenase